MKLTRVTLIVLTCLLTGLAGCATGGETPPGATPLPTTPPIPSPAPPTATPTQPPPTPSLVPPTDMPTRDGYPDCYSIIEWTRYSDPEWMMSIDVPANWEVNEGSINSSVWSPDKKCFVRIGLEANQDVTTSPSSYPDNEGGFRSVWEQPIETQPWRGWKYIWSSEGSTGRSDMYFILIGVDEFSGRNIKLEVDWDYESHMLAQEEGFEVVTSERFGFLDHMLMSIEFQTN